MKAAARPPVPQAVPTSADAQGRALAEVVLAAVTEPSAHVSGGPACSVLRAHMFSSTRQSMSFGGAFDHIAIFLIVWGLFSVDLLLLCVSCIEKFL